MDLIVWLHTIRSLSEREGIQKMTFPTFEVAFFNILLSGA
jgi:hypothetical protein